MSILHLDFETCSFLDLRKVGADVYSRDPKLIVTVVAWAFDDDPVESINGPGMPVDVAQHLVDGGRFKAWNASFEWAILTNHYNFKLDPKQALCTMQKALHSGLPPALAEAGPAIGANTLKDTTAHRLMMQLSKPRRSQTQATYSYWHVDEPGKLKALAEYCKRDVEAERDIDRMIAELPPSEQAVSILDRKANQLGVRLDLNLVKALKELARAETKILDAECSTLTQGAVTSPGTQTARLLAWLTSQGIEIANLSKEAVSEALKGFLAPTARRVLEIRSEVAKSSLKKLDAMERCVGPQDRVRGQLAYYGAFRTGRFAGRLVQPQNFPRPLIQDTKSFVRYVSRSHLPPPGLSPGRAEDGRLEREPHPDPDFVRAVWGNPLDAVASSLRSCLVPGHGKAFVVRDLSQIEARVIAWLAGQQDVLAVFERGEDVYAYTQNKVGLKSRQEGKVVTLGLGFGMGPIKFVDTAAKSNLTFTMEESETIVRDWREANPKIVQFWWKLDDVAKGLLRDFHGATLTRPVNAKIQLCVSQARNKTCLLSMLLPSGRRLYYRNAQLEKDEKYRDAIVYDGLDTYTKKWGKIRTYGAKLAENATQATARDIIVEAALQVDARDTGASLVLSVHDELLWEVDEAQADEQAIMIEREVDLQPVWAADLPLASEGSVLRRYGKG